MSEPLPDPLEEYYQKIVGIVRKHGWAIQYVMGSKDSAPFTYTVGLSVFNAPELLIAGVPHDAAGSILNRMAGEVKDGKRWKAGDRVKGFLRGGLELVIIEVACPDDDLNLANRFAGDAAPVRALQVVWPDTHLHYPWELEWDMGPEIQPLRGPSPQS